MILDGGQLDGQRILNRNRPSREMDQAPPPARRHRLPRLRLRHRHALLRLAAATASRRGTTFGHTGFTGTMFWIDPVQRLLRHPADQLGPPRRQGRPTIELRQRVATVVADALLGSIRTRAGPPSARRAGAGRDRRAEGAKASSRCRAGRSRWSPTTRAWTATGTARSTCSRGAKDVKRRQALLPRARAVRRRSTKRSPTRPTRRPACTSTASTARPRSRRRRCSRAWTRSSSTSRTSASATTPTRPRSACAWRPPRRRKVKMVVLDRPQPDHRAAVSTARSPSEVLRLHLPTARIPLAHGMTDGRAGRLFNDEYEHPLRPVRSSQWRTGGGTDVVGRHGADVGQPVAEHAQPDAGPGLPRRSASWRRANLSVGRGTDQPFELFGAPWIDGRKLAAALNAANLPGPAVLADRPSSRRRSKFAGKECQGVYLDRHRPGRPRARPRRPGDRLAFEKALRRPIRDRRRREDGPERGDVRGAEAGGRPREDSGLVGKAAGGVQEGAGEVFDVRVGCRVALSLSRYSGRG